MATNVELRRSNGTNYNEVIHLKTSVALVEGLLDENNKIKASLLPSFVFGGMRFVTTLGSYTEITDLHDMFDDFVATHGGSIRGCYAICNGDPSIAVSISGESLGYLIYSDEGGTPVTDGEIDIEMGDWLICISDDGKTWAIINNTYHIATTTTTGIVRLATEQDGIEGTSGLLAMTPKATVAAISAKAYQHPTYTGNDLGAPLTGPKVISDINVNSFGHVTGFATRNLTLADLGFTGDSNANYYVHPNMTGMPLTLSLNSLEHISNIQIDEQGHVKAVSKVGIPTASESTTGVVTLASSSEAKGGTNNSKVLTPARAKEMIDKFASIELVQSLPTDMSNHPAGKLILLQI